MRSGVAMHPDGLDSPGAGRDRSGARAAQASRVVTAYTAAASSLAALPLPTLVSSAAVAAVQIKAIHALARLYGVPFRRERVHALVGTLLAQVALSGAADTFDGALRLLPGIGQVYGAVRTAGGLLAVAAATYALGSVFAEHFERGGTLLDFDLAQMKMRYSDLRHRQARAAAV